MIKKIHILFLLLFILALGLIGYDYVCGHMGENPFIPNNCPLCAAYQSAELGHMLLAALLTFGILPIIGFLRPVRWFSPIPLYLINHSLRAPPPDDNLF